MRIMMKASQSVLSLPRKQWISAVNAGLRLLLKAIFLSAIAAEAIGHLASIERLQSVLESRFSAPRHTDEEKLPVVTFINETFAKLKMPTFVQELFSFDGRLGRNIIGLLPGRFYNTPLDRIVLIGAHYDTVSRSNGVNDNGSGMTSLLESARILSKISEACRPNFTTMFAAFDLEETGFVGSSLFADQWLPTFLKERKGGELLGAIILDTVMNYDDMPATQELPDEFAKHFPNQQKSILGHHHAGDYLQLVMRWSGDFLRSNADKKLADAFANAFAVSKKWSSETIKPWLVSLEVPMENLKTPQQIYPYMQYIKSDHRSFWFNSRSVVLPAIHISDSAHLRGKMQYCYHTDCDDISIITSKNLEFMATTVDAVVRTVALLTQSPCSDTLHKCEANFFQPCLECSLLLARSFRYDCSYAVDLKPFFQLVQLNKRDFYYKYLYSRRYKFNSDVL